MKKIIVDILLVILTLIEFSRVYLNPTAHEVIGIFLIMLLIMHLILNRNYLKAIHKGRYNFKRTLKLIVNLALLVMFILMCIMGLLSSQATLTFLNIGNLTTVYLHKIFSYITLIILGMHLGLSIKFKENNTIFYIIYAVIIALGIYSFAHTDFLNHLTGNFGFSLANTSLLINTVEYGCILLTTAILVKLTAAKL